jgi:pantoate--beta-alanine ligase
MYLSSSGNPYSTFVQEEQLSRFMEGQSRPTHFRGVATIVAKLFHIAQPTVAVFGQKDFQQAAIIRRMVRDLNFDLRVAVARTVREKDGLAMSSRNRYLGRSEREQATVLYQAIAEARRKVKRANGGIPAHHLRRSLEAFIRRRPSARIDYISFFEPNSLESVKRVTPGTHLALAVFIGKTRLIDNARL